MSGDALSLGDPAPPLELVDTDGGPHALPEVGEAAATVVLWTCNHCPYALAWHNRILDVARDSPDVRFLAVNSNDAERYPADSPEAMRERVEAEGGWPFPYLHDPSQAVARAFGARTTPDVFVFDSELRLRYRGAPDGDHQDASQEAAWLRGALAALAVGDEPKPAETHPVGCSIKWRE